MVYIHICFSYLIKYIVRSFLYLNCLWICFNSIRRSF
nr:MAG TPA: hypothetical protein [Bacteriophage sp.]